MQCSLLAVRATYMKDNPMKNEINRGDIFFAMLDPVIGSEQGGMRPVCCIQNQTGNRHSPTTIVAPITSQSKKPLPTHIVLSGQPDIEEDSVLMMEQIRTIDKSRIGQLVGRLSPDLLEKLDRALTASLDLPRKYEDPMLMTLCKNCADHYRGTRMYTLRWIDSDNRIKEPCTLCSRPGFDYEVARRPDKK